MSKNINTGQRTHRQQTPEDAVYSATKANIQNTHKYDK